ncbi:hypothetical protein PIB30_104991, partial [Stylosanthes scabra]|nr:hypothetical protein [Stylosanthes scabra]
MRWDREIDAEMRRLHDFPTQSSPSAQGAAGQAAGWSSTPQMETGLEEDDGVVEGGLWWKKAAVVEG